MLGLLQRLVWQYRGRWQDCLRCLRGSPVRSGLYLADQSGFSAEFGRKLRRILSLLLLLLCGLELSRVLLHPLSRHVCKISASNSSENDGYKMRWYATLHGLP